MYHQTLSTIIATIAIITATKDNTPENMAINKLPSLIFSTSKDAIRKILANIHKTKLSVIPSKMSISILNIPTMIDITKIYSIHLHIENIPIVARLISTNVALGSLTSFCLALFRCYTNLSIKSFPFSKKWYLLGKTSLLWINKQY